MQRSDSCSETSQFSSRQGVSSTDPNNDGGQGDIEDQQLGSSLVQEAEDGISSGGRIEEWSLYEHAFNALEASFLVYAFADLRIYARKGLFDSESSDDILTVPIRIQSVIELLWKHKDALMKKWGEFETKLFEDAIDNVEKRLEVAAYREGQKGYLDSKSGIRTFHDNNNEECTYVIVVNTLTKNISVIFRGTKQLSDLEADAKMAMKTTPNPLADINGQPDAFHLHRGFAGYLFKSSSSTISSRRWDSTRVGTKCQEILNDVLEVLTDNPSFTVAVTGHSMGGALAALFAFEIASMRVRDPELIQKTVECIMIASPMVGDNKFRKAFQYLEMNGHLQCLRVENDLDIVPMYPWTSLSFLGVPFSPFFPNLRYRHVGVQLKLHVYADTFEIAYPKHRTGVVLFLLDLWSTIKRVVWLILCCICASAKEVTNHHCGEYRRRLKVNAKALHFLDLKDIYERIKGGEHGLLETKGSLRLKAVEPRLQRQ